MQPGNKVGTIRFQIDEIWQQTLEYEHMDVKTIKAGPELGYGYRNRKGGIQNGQELKSRTSSYTVIEMLMRTAQERFWED